MERQAQSARRYWSERWATQSEEQNWSNEECKGVAGRTGRKYDLDQMNLRENYMLKRGNGKEEERVERKKCMIEKGMITTSNALYID